MFIDMISNTIAVAINTTIMKAGHNRNRIIGITATSDTTFTTFTTLAITTVATWTLQ